MTTDSESNVQRTDAYYAEKDKIRFMMVTSKAHKDILTKRCKQLGVSQGAFLEALLDVADAIDPLVFNAAIQNKREEKKSSRVSFSSINKQLKGLSKEQLAAIEKAIAEQRSKPGHE